jgi:hypothetical protein
VPRASAAAASISDASKRRSYGRGRQADDVPSGGDHRISAFDVDAQIIPIGPACATVTVVARLGSFTIPGFVMTIIWIVLVILVIILLAWIVHLAGGGLFEVKLGHFKLLIGVT